MKIISDIDLKDFNFWSGARDTAAQLDDDQFEQLEAILEDAYPDGMTDTQLNDIFWFDSDTIFEWVGRYPKYFKVTSSCGLTKYVKAEDADDVREIEDSVIKSEEVEEGDCYSGVENLSDVDLDEFDDIRYFAIWSRHSKNKLILHCADYSAEDLKNSFSMCKVEEITEVPAGGIDGEEDWEEYENDYGMIDGFVYDEDEMHDCYDIPVYAIPRICKLILDPDDTLDYYEIPESHAIIEQNRYLELNDDDIKNIDEFVAGLHKALPDGFTIDWDVESIASPSFDPHPAFGLAMDCVKLRVYPKD